MKIKKKRKTMNKRENKILQYKKRKRWLIKEAHVYIYKKHLKLKGEKRK